MYRQQGIQEKTRSLNYSDNYTIEQEWHLLPIRYQARAALLSKLPQTTQDT